MNVMVCNKFKELLKGLNIEVIKSLEGVYNVDEIIDTFTNFYFDKMILDITSIRDYQNTDNLQKLAMNLNMENVILLLDDNPETDNAAFISKLISLGIYNFTKNINGINYLLVHPHTLKDVVNIHNIQELDDRINQTNNPSTPQNSFIPNEVGAMPTNNNTGGGKLRIIGFKNVTNHAGATSLIYMLKKTLQNSRVINAIEINKVDFLYFNDKDMISVEKTNLANELLKRRDISVILVDMNKADVADLCTDVLYLVEPSTIKLNKLMRIDRKAFEKLAGKKVVINQNLLSDNDIRQFEYEAKIKVFSTLPPLDERVDNTEILQSLLNKVGIMNY